jgi:hypothetical protein
MSSLRSFQYAKAPQDTEIFRRRHRAWRVKRKDRLISHVYLVCLVCLGETDQPDRADESDEPQTNPPECAGNRLRILSPIDHNG